MLSWSTTLEKSLYHNTLRMFRKCSDLHPAEKKPSRAECLVLGICEKTSPLGIKLKYRKGELEDEVVVLGNFTIQLRIWDFEE